VEEGHSAAFTLVLDRARLGVETTNGVHWAQGAPTNADTVATLLLAHTLPRALEEIAEGFTCAADATGLVIERHGQPYGHLLCKAYKRYGTDGVAAWSGSAGGRSFPAGTEDEEGAVHKIRRNLQAAKPCFLLQDVDTHMFFRDIVGIVVETGKQWNTGTDAAATVRWDTRLTPLPKQARKWKRVHDPLSTACAINGRARTGAYDVAQPDTLAPGRYRVVSYDPVSHNVQEAMSAEDMMAQVLG
jgi:hypothetical protein